MQPIFAVTTGLALCALTSVFLSRKVRPALARLRPHVPERLARLARRVDPAIARSALVTSIAAGMAWSAAGILHLAGPVTAAISATLSVQLSTHASVREGTQRLIGTLAGIALTVAVWGTFGLTPWSIAVITGLGLAAGRMLRLGDSAVTVPLTSLGILVAGSAVTETFVWERIGATALGIVVGAILSPLVGGMTPLERARWELGRLSTEIARLLSDLGAGARDGYTRDEAAGWLSRSRSLDDDLKEAVSAVDDLLRQARWSLRTPTSRVAPLEQTLRALEHGVDQVNSVARSMFDAAATPHSPGVPPQIGEVLTAASSAFAAEDNLQDQLQTLRDVRRDTLRKVRTELDDTGVLVLTGSIISDIDRMAGTLERSAPALTVGVRETGPGIPAVSEVLPAVRLMWRKAAPVRSTRVFRRTTTRVAGAASDSPRRRPDRPAPRRTRAL